MKPGLWIAGLALASMVVFAGEGKTDRPTDAKSAFARLKAQAGTWETNTEKGKGRVKYEVIAAGSAVVEHESAEKMPEMMTVYTLDGNRLLLTHYCAAGNQPRMQAKSFNPETGEVRFEFLDATNLREGAGHMHNMTMRFLDADHFSSDWEFYENGKKTMAESFEYKRVE